MRSTLETIKKEFVIDPKNITIQEEKLKLQNKLELMKMEKTKGAQIRAGIKWIEKGRKNTKFCLNLERRRAENNTINRLVKRDGEIVTDGSQIIKEIKSYYAELYREDKSEEMIKQKANLFSRNLQFPTLTAEQRYQT